VLRPKDGGIPPTPDDRFERRRRSRRSARRSRVAAVWLVATFIGLSVAATTAIGPVVLRLSKTHGVHAGDLAGFGVCYLTALVITARILCTTAVNDWSR
jgi:hypothetical protein